jgi:hypothetical protein
LETKEEVKQYFPGILAFIDYTEQPIQRPKDKKKKVLLLWKEKETHSKEPVHSKPKWPYNLQNKT